MYLLGIPLLLIPFAIYNIMAFILGMSFTETVFEVPMLSRAVLAVTAGDLLVMFAILLLYVEILKATRLGSRAILDHVLSLVLFLFMAAEFMIVAQAATGTFLLLLLVSLLDVVAGFSITIQTAQRDLLVGGVERMG
ncbi:MAG TPA: hypothetical protein VNQ99_10225 [Xanthobacteraceae bacterium]|nr:hypothetical protein [Xanthobacteraceae bacterium]